ncbi:MAG: glutathione S-transferase, partial [Polaromonas sp.]
LARLRAVDAALQRQEFLCAGRFTAADVSVGYALLLAGHLGLELQFPDAVRRYAQRLQQRPAFLRALQAQHQAALDQGVPTIAAPDVRPGA